MGDYYIKDAESKEYLDIINSVKMNKIPLVGYVSDIKKCIQENYTYFILVKRYNGAFHQDFLMSKTVKV